MKKSIFTKYLPFVAAVLLAASCSKDNGGDGIINLPSSIEESAQSVQTPDESNTVAIPFSVRVSSGASLSKFKYTDKAGEVVDKVVVREFEPDDCGTIQLLVSGDGATALLDLKSRTEGGKTIYYFDGTVNVAPGKEAAFKSGGIDLVGTFTTNSKATTYYSTTSLLDLEQNVCKHVYKAEFKSDATSITFVDQNAYLCLTVAAIQTEIRLSFNGGNITEIYHPNAETHKIWIAVPCGRDGKPTVKCALIGNGVMDLECGTVYDVDRHDKYEEDYVVFVDLGTNDGKWWATCNLGAENQWDYGDYYAWGETTTKDDYSWSTYAYGRDAESGEEHAMVNKYCPSDSPNYWYYVGETATNPDNKTVLDPADDIAHVTNSNWSMPTKEDFDNLLSRCDWVWTDNYNGSGVKGNIVYKEKDSYTNLATDTHIFLPAAGYRDGTNLKNDVTRGYYWSSSLLDPHYAWRLGFGSDYAGMYTYERYNGFPVRPVRVMN